MGKPGVNVSESFPVTDSLRVHRAGNHYDVSRGINDDNIVGTGIGLGPEIGPVEFGVGRRGIV